MDTTKQDIMRAVGEEFSPFLETGKIYYTDIIKNTYGSQGGNIFYTKDGIDYNYKTKLNPEEKKALTDEFDRLYDNFNSLKSEDDFSKLYYDLPADTQVRFTFIKDEPVAMKIYGVADFVLALKKTFAQKADKCTPENPFIKIEGIGHFIQQADELNIAADLSEVSKDSIYSDDSFYGLGIDLINTALDRQLKSIWFRYENDTLTIQTEPAFPEHGFSPIENTAIALSPEYTKRKEAAAEAIRLRHEFYRSVGTLHDEILYLNVGGFRDHKWPGYSSGPLSAKLRVIYTDTTTIVITDGLSDVYNDSYTDKELKYNGTGAEYYIEFDSIVPFAKVKDHYMLALLNSATQVALGHGEFKALVEKFETLTLQFNADNVETWVIKDNNSNNEATTFFNSSQYHADKLFGTLMGMESKSLPKKVKLNIEEILLVSVKPFGKNWFTKDKLLNAKEDVKTKARMEIIKGFEEDGSFNTIPVSYP